VIEVDSVTALTLLAGWLDWTSRTCQ